MDYAIVFIFLVAIAAFAFATVQKQKAVYAEAAVEEDDVIELTDEVVDAPKAKTCRCITQNVYRNRKGQRARVGVLVSCIKGNKVRIGFSLCNKVDAFDIKEAYALASSRLGEKEVVVPHSLKKDLAIFTDRCARYYKHANIAKFDGTKIVNG